MFVPVGNGALGRREADSVAHYVVRLTNSHNILNLEAIFGEGAAVTCGQATRRVVVAIPKASATGGGGFAASCRSHHENKWPSPDSNRDAGSTATDFESVSSTNFDRGPLLVLGCASYQNVRAQSRPT